MLRDLTADYVRSILHYDPETGVFMWRVRPLDHFKSSRDCKRWNNRFAGAVSGSGSGDNYWHICIDDCLYKAHRLAWLYMTGNWPKEQIDHIDGDKVNNRFCNLREATHAQNCANKIADTDSCSGRRGVVPASRGSKWYAVISKHGKRIHIGTFDTAEDAAAAYASAAREIHGEFARFA